MRQREKYDIAAITDWYSLLHTVVKSAGGLIIFITCTWDSKRRLSPRLKTHLTSLC